MWLLTGFDVRASKAESPQRMISWEPGAASALCEQKRKEKGAPGAPFSGLIEEFKCAKARLEMILSLCKSTECYCLSRTGSSQVYRQHFGIL